MSNTINIPQSPFVDIKTGMLAPEWLQWLINPSFLSIQTGTALGTASGGTGTSNQPALNQIPVGTVNGTYTPTVTLPAAALPAFTGDVTSPLGVSINTLANVNSNVGTWGSGTAVSSFTVNAKGLITLAGNVNITGSTGPFTVVGAFGCNAKSAQAAVSSGAAVATTAATNAVPWGYTTQAQADRIVALLNTIQAALIANGILT